MEPISSAILIDIASNIIISGIKNIYDFAKKTTSENISTKIKNLLSKHIDDSLSIAIDSNNFIEYINSPQITDIFYDYFIYSITDELTYGMKKIKSTKNSYKNIIIIDDIIKYLVDNFYNIYGDQHDIVNTIPTRLNVEKFFRLLLLCSNEIFYNELSNSQKIGISLISRKIDIRYDNIEFLLRQISDKIDKDLKYPVIKIHSENDEIKKKYTLSLKKLFEIGYIYPMGEYNFNEFYISSRLQIHNRISDDYDTNDFFEHGKLINYEDIFESSNTIYVIGGAGFGKTLFMHNLVNNFEKLHVNDSNKHLIIYCELKSFYSDIENNNKKSIIDYLQESIITKTGIDSSDVSKEFINYYLNIGRCIILFDGLDEVIKQNRNELHKKIIVYFQNYNPNNKICITSRGRNFIPQDDVEVIRICTLHKREISKYIDNMIKLKKFKKSDKSTFIEQTDILIERKFLNNLLILSLLINVFKSERRLPTNKVDLYRKCFEYIAKEREEGKSNKLYDWDLVYPLMKDSTFIRLAVLAAPNNNDIDRTIIENHLATQYKRMYSEQNKLEKAIKQFLEFCSARTDLFVPSSTDDKFKFFHRSFFEYFYSRFLNQTTDVLEIYNLMTNFDVDSEVFELTVALVKEENAEKYEDFLELIFNKVKNAFKNPTIDFLSFNMLTLVMQVVDDEYFLKEYFDIIIDNSFILANEIGEISNHNIISQILSNIIDKDINHKLKQDFFMKYEKYSAAYIFRLVSRLQFGNDDISDTLNMNFFDIRSSRYKCFYLILFIQSMDILKLLNKYANLNETEFFDLLSIKEENYRKVYENNIIEGYRTFNYLNEQDRKKFSSIFSIDKLNV